MTPNDPAVSNSWGALQNSGQIALIDTAIAGHLALSVAGSANVVLTAVNGAADQARNATFTFTGVLTGNINVLWPAAPRGSVFSVYNNTTGAFTLSCGVTDGSGSPVGAVVAVPQGGILPLRSDGIDVFRNVSISGIGGLVAANNLSDVASATASLTNLGGVPTTRTITAGSGLSGGGDLSTNRTVAIAAVASGKMLANETTGSAVPSAVNIPGVQRQTFRGSGTFTVPAGTTAATVFNFYVTGAGGGGGGTNATGQCAAGGGGSGGSGVASFNGFTAAQAVTITIGAAGAAGNTSGTSGGTGGASKVTAAAVDIATSTGGVGGAGATVVNTQYAGGAAGAFSATAGASGLTLADSASLLSSAGGTSVVIVSNEVGGSGGNNQFGAGGAQTSLNNGGNVGVQGGGGSGASNSSAVGRAGGAGGAGIIIVEWVL